MEENISGTPIGQIRGTQTLGFQIDICKSGADPLGARGTMPPPPLQLGQGTLAKEESASNLWVK